MTIKRNSSYNRPTRPLPHIFYLKAMRRCIQLLMSAPLTIGPHPQTVFVEGFIVLNKESEVIAPRLDVVDN